MKKKIKQLFYQWKVMSLLLFGIILVTGCSGIKSLNAAPQDKNITTIKSVLKQQFTGPEEYISTRMAK
ncbi:hypothetical protein [Bacillus sp. AFS088145]|uniref:hypothetical protein n=1 Tax=Bacillus sp. AFS088145 TaxID=2033514 RepID=UPI001155EE27|nr:hypothetical protein [Bacillus sp. AFS088145]